MSVKAILLLALSSAPASAQLARDTARIAPIVVTATRSVVATGRAPASVSVITGSQLRREGITTVLDALRQVPGLSVVQTGSYGGQTSVFIRGGESKFAKVLVDGVPVNDAGGAFDFSTLSTDNLERIEIVRGPASVLYGSEAMAGVIQLFTRPGGGPRHAELSARGGGLGSYDGEASVRGGGGGMAYSLGAAQHATNGIQSFNSKFRQGVGSGMLGIRGTAGDAQLSLRYTDNVLHFPTNGSGEVVDSNAQHRDDRLAVGLDAGYRLVAMAELRLSLASYDVHGVSEDQPDSPGDKNGYYFSTGDRTRRRSGDLRLNVDLPRDVRVTVGAQTERQWQASETNSNFGANDFTARRRTTGGYGQVLFAPSTAYSITLGGRYEHNERFGDFRTWRAAGNAQLATNTRLRGSVGTAFREPTFLENYGGAFVIGNPALTPEHAFSLDAGVEQAIGDVATVGATVFANSFRDLIDYKYSATAPNYFNLARTRASGVEIEVRAALSDDWRVDASATFLNTRVVDPGTSKEVTATFAPGAPLLRRPSRTVDGGIGYHVARGGIDLRAHHVGPREDNYYAPDFSVKHVTLASYTRTDLSGELALPVVPNTSAALTFRAENLFDVRYTDVAGFNYDFALRDPASIARTGYRGAGRRVLVGLRLSL